MAELEREEREAASKRKAAENAFYAKRNRVLGQDPEQKARWRAVQDRIREEEAAKFEAKYGKTVKPTPPTREEPDDLPAFDHWSYRNR